MHQIRLLAPAEAEAAHRDLVDLLFDCVEGGASVNFVQPMTREKSEHWWQGALASHARNERLILVAEADGRIDGSVQIIPAGQETSPTVPISQSSSSTAAPAATASAPP